MSKGSTIPMIPDSPSEIPTLNWTPSAETMKIMQRVHPRIALMLEVSEPYKEDMRLSLYGYDAVSRTNSKDKRDEQIVMPMAKIFVESKTSEEIRAFNGYQYIPRSESRDSWKSELIKDMNTHYQRKTKMSSKKHRLIRMKNIAGLSIARVGYRKITRKIKERIMDNQDAIAINYKKKEAVVYDDLFFDVVSPLDFGIDPNATTIDEAMDCVQLSTRNYEEFLEIYGNDPRMDKEAIKAVKPSLSVYMDGQDMKVNNAHNNNTVPIVEYFNKIRCEWVVLVSGIVITKPDTPLPDDHLELPFVVYHNDPSFTIESMNKTYSQFSPNSGEEVSQTSNVSGHESFWTRGDPAVIRDLVELYTGFSRAMFRNAKLAGESIVLTRGNFRIDTGRPWRTGDPIIGGAGKVETMSLANPNTGNMERMFDTLMQIMILTIGVDPRNLADDTSSRTATQAAIMRETAMKRLEANIQYNEENGETRLGELSKELILQYYSKPEVTALTGAESPEDLKSFHDIEKNNDTGLPEFGRTYRRIPSTIKLKETRKGRKDGTYKYYLTKSEEGINSFLSRPDYTRVSDVDVITTNDRKLTEIRAVKIAQSREAIELYNNMVPLTQAIEGEEAAISKDDLPKLKSLVRMYVTSLGLDPETDIGNGGDSIPSEQVEFANILQDEIVNPEPEQLPQPLEQFAQ